MVFYTSDPNLVILAWKGDKLSHGQAHDCYTYTQMDTETDAGDDNTRRPKLASGKKQHNEANLRDLIAVTGLVSLSTLLIFRLMWPRYLMDDLEK